MLNLIDAFIQKLHNCQHAITVTLLSHTVTVITLMYHCITVH